MRLTAALLLATCAFSAHAGTVSKFNISANVSLTQGCGDETCFVKGKLKLSSSGEMDISPSEVAQIGADTTVEISGILGGGALRIGDDPNYQLGDTSAEINTSATIGGGFTGTIPVKVQASWAGGKFSITQTISGKLNDTIPHPASPTMPASLSTLGDLLNAAQVKSHSPMPLITTIAVKNSGSAFAQGQAQVFADFTTAIIMSQKADGTVSQGQNVKLKTKGFQPIAVP